MKLLDRTYVEVWETKSEDYPTFPQFHAEVDGQIIDTFTSDELIEKILVRCAEIGKIPDLIYTFRGN